MLPRVILRETANENRTLSSVSSVSCQKYNIREWNLDLKTNGDLPSLRNYKVSKKEMSLPCEAYAIDKVELRNQASKTLLSNLNRNMVPAKNVITAANHVLKNGRRNVLLGKNMICYKSTNHILKGETVRHQDGVILKGGRKVIPSSLRDKKKETTLSTLTRDLVVSPAMSQELRQVVENYQLQVIRRRQ